MVKNEEKLTLLKEANPFTASSVGDPWEEKYPDVKSVNEDASEQITRLIEQKGKSPGHPCAGLIFGEVGSGKTHLISRILKYGKNDNFSFSFAYVQPIEDVEQTYRYFLREVIVNLCYPIDRTSDRTQLDIILEKSLQEVRDIAQPVSGIERVHNFLFAFKADANRFLKEKNLSLNLLRNLKKRFKDVLDDREYRDADPLVRKAIACMRRKFPDIPKEFFKVLFQYQQPEKRSAVVEWLKGGAIDEEDAASLRVADRMTHSPALMEQNARNMLHYIGMLLEFYHKPLIICFDRLENYDTDEKIRSLGKIVEFLVDKVRAMLPLVFVRGQQWEEKFTKKLNQQVITRLKTNEFKLKGCNTEQSLEIVRTRLETVLSKGFSRSQAPAWERENAFFPFDENELRHMFEARLHSPRQVIILANQRLRQTLYPEKEPPKPVVPLDKLQHEFDGQCQNIRADMDRYPPDRSRLKRALELYLKHSTGFETESLDYPEEKYIDFECRIQLSDGTSRTVIFIIDIESNHSTVRASLTRGVDFLEKQGADGMAVYIRDSRCTIPPPPNWKATNEVLQRFGELGGNVISLDIEQTSEWYALSLLNYAVKEGDITITDADNNPIQITTDELADFVREKIHGSTYSGFQPISAILNAPPANS